MWTIITHCMLWLLFTECIVAENDCYWVRIIYWKMGGRFSMIPQDCCRMKGVSCLDGHVIQLRWRYHNLNGYIPPEIGKLVHLKWL